MLIQSKVGAPTSTTSLSAGQIIEPRLGNMGDQILSQLHGKYYEGTYRRAVFSGGNAAGVVTTVGTAATYTGLALTNPIGNTYNLVLLKVGVAWKIVQPTAAMIFGLMTTYSAGTAATQSAAITPANNFIGIGQAATGLLAAGCAAANTWGVRAIFGSLGTGALSVPTTQPPIFYDMEGSIILPPGACVAIFSDVISGAASLFGSFTWEEVPI